MATELQESIIRELTSGRTIREVAEKRNMTIPEVNSILDQMARRCFSAEGMRRRVFLEVEKLEMLKQLCFMKAVREQDLHAVGHYVKASERQSSMMGMNHPQGHIVTVTSTLDNDQHETSSTRMLEAIRRLRHETPEAEETPAEKLN